MSLPNRRRPSGRSRWLRGLVFRLAAVALGLTPFVLAEAVFAVLGWGDPTYSDDPFVGFRDVHPLFVLNAEGDRYEIAPSRQGFFRPDSFRRQKGPGEFRIFCLGGSTVQGRPFAIETSFTTWLELTLRTADPERQWEVVNCGGISYASYRLVLILEEILGYEPDLIILYTGHNEFLEDRTYHHIKYMPEIVARPCKFVLGTRTYTLLRERYVRCRGRDGPPGHKDRPVLETETDAMLEYRGGLEQYHRDDKWRRDVIEHFRYNLRRMAHLAHEAGVPLLLVNPVCNLRDCPPFKTQHRDGLTPDERKHWESLVSKAANRQGTNAYQAVLLLEEAKKIDDRHAGLHYLLAKCYDAQGMMKQAHASYLKAKELDVCPLRILEPMHEAILEVARRTDTPVVDVRKTFEQLTDSGIPGGLYLIDYVHPSIEGHQLIADALADALVRRGVVVPGPDWKEKRDRVFREHLDLLDSFYFSKGQERLRSLKRWAQGKATGERTKPALKPASHGAPNRPAN